MKVSLVRVGERQRRHFYKGWGLLAKKCGWKSLLKSLNYYTIMKNHFNYDMIFYVTSIKIVYIYNVRKKKGKIKIKKCFRVCGVGGEQVLQLAPFCFLFLTR